MNEIKQPATSLNEMLWNVKLLIAEGALDKEETYLHPELAQTFGGEDIHWMTNVQNHRRAEITGFEKIIPKLYSSNGNAFDGMGLNFNFNATENQKGPFTWFSFIFRMDSNIRFEVIEEIFGTNWELDEAAVYARVLQTGRIFKTSTHKMGNSPILYHLDSDPFARIITIETSFDGTLSHFRYETESNGRKKWLKAHWHEQQKS